MNSLKNPWGMGDWQFGRSTTLPAQSGLDHMEAVSIPKSSGTSTEEDSSKKPDADVVVDKLCEHALKQQKISEDHRRKLLKQRQKLLVEGRTVTTEPLTMQDRGTDPPCTSLLKTVATVGRWRKGGGALVALNATISLPDLGI